MTTTTTTNKDIQRRMIEDVWGDGELGFIDEVVADDYVEHNTASPEDIRGPAGYRENVEMVRAAFPDMEIRTETLVAEGETVGYQYTIVGTHQGPLMGIEPTERPVEIAGMGLAQFDDGQLVEGWSNVDVLGMMQQLGVVDPPTA